MKYFVECCGCDYRNGKTKGVNMGLGVENSVNAYNQNYRYQQNKTTGQANH